MSGDPSDVTDDAGWTAHVPEWLVTARKLSFVAVGVGVLLTALGMGLGEAAAIGGGMTVMAVPLVLMGLVDLLVPEWGHHAGFRRYHEPTADPPTDDERRAVRRYGALILVLAATLTGGFVWLALGV